MYNSVDKLIQKPENNSDSLNILNIEPDPSIQQPCNSANRLVNKIFMYEKLKIVI